MPIVLLCLTVLLYAVINLLETFCRRRISGAVSSRNRQQKSSRVRKRRLPYISIVSPELYCAVGSLFSCSTMASSPSSLKGYL